MPSLGLRGGQVGFKAAAAAAAAAANFFWELGVGFSMESHVRAATAPRK